MQHARLVHSLKGLQQSRALVVFIQLYQPDITGRGPPAFFILTVVPAPALVLDTEQQKPPAFFLKTAVPALALVLDTEQRKPVDPHHEEQLDHTCSASDIRLGLLWKPSFGWKPGTYSVTKTHCMPALMRKEALLLA